MRLACSDTKSCAMTRRALPSAGLMARVAGLMTWKALSNSRIACRSCRQRSPANQQIALVEGEKDADALWRIGLPATTNSGGAGKWPPELNQHFKGAQVVIIPDADKQGRAHCKLVGSALQGIAASIDVLELPDLPEKGDASDWIAAGGTAEQLRALPNRPWTEWLAAQPVHVETDDERLARLAALNPLDYDRCRKAEAAAAGVQLRALDDAVKQYRGEVTADTDDLPDFLIDPEPWSEPVDGADLLDGIVDAISAHMVLPKGAASAIALWVVHCPRSRPIP